MIRLKLKNCNTIITAKIWALLSCKIDKYEYLTRKEIDESRIIEQAMSTYSPLRNALEKQIKAIENQSESNALIKI